MNTHQIAHVLRTDPFCKTDFQGVHALDRLKSVKLRYPCALVVNTDPSYLPGEHWVAIFLNASRHGEYFDSYGLPPSIYPDIAHFLIRNCESFRYNSHLLQGLGSTVCGQYVLFYLLHRCRGYTLDEITGWFSPNLDTNDEQVQGFINKHFPCVDCGGAHLRHFICATSVRSQKKLSRNVSLRAGSTIINDRNGRTWKGFGKGGYYGENKGKKGNTQGAVGRLKGVNKKMDCRDLIFFLNSILTTL